MKAHFPEDSVLNRTKNFRWNVEKLEKRFREDKDSFLDLEIFRDDIITFCKHGFIKSLSASERLERVLRKIYDMIRKPEFILHLGERAYEAYEFAVCSSFLHTSKRVKGMSIDQFIQRNGPRRYYQQPGLRQSDAEMLRKARERRLRQGPVYVKKNTQWNAITKDNEHEWKFYFALKEADEVVRDTEKRMGNLYKGIKAAIYSERDDQYESRVEGAYKKFLSKLAKLQYENYLKLCKEAISHICEDKTYYGMNIYRLEKRLQPYKIIKEVKKLAECRSSEEETDLLLRMVYLDEICFPKIYEALLHNPVNLVEKYAGEFLHIWQEETFKSGLILDELVEKGFWGEDWETLLRNKVNGMAEEVFYDPQKVDFFIADQAQAQEKFARILHAGVFIEICAAFEKSAYMTELLI